MYFPEKVVGSVLKFDFSSFLQFALKNRFRHRSKQFPKREHWLDWAKEKYDVSGSLSLQWSRGLPPEGEHPWSKLGCRTPATWTKLLVASL